MNMQMLENFLIVAKEKSFSKAAETLYVSQPALSKQIKKLEESLGFSLFLRSSSGIKLTKKGEDFYQDVEPIYRTLQSMLVKHTQHSSIRLGSDPVLATYYYPDYIHQTSTETLQLTTIRDDSLDLLPLLETGEIDAAVVQDYPAHPWLFSTHLFTDIFYAAVPVDHPLAQWNSIPITECFRYTNLLPPAHTPMNKNIRKLIKTHGVPAPEFIEVSYHALAGFISQGYGISYLPSLMVEKIDYKGVLFIPLEDTPLKREMYLYTQQESVLLKLKRVLSKY
jgi:DNA-binding transcriptional LysR family regulator